MKIKFSTKQLLFTLVSLVLVMFAVLTPAVVRAAGCPPPTTDYGSVTTALAIPASATYRLWSRIMAPDTTNNTYLLEVDGANCYTIGGGSIPASTWTWVDYQGGNSSSKLDLALTPGSHSLKLIGNKPGVKVDRVLALSDLGCAVTGLGDGCTTPSDTTPPTVSLTAPADGASVSGSVALAATATDNTGVTKVDFYDNSTLILSDTTAPYGATWNSAAVPNDSHLITAKAYDAAGNVGSDNRTVLVQNGDQQAPTVPSNVSATAPAYNRVALTWSASTDNVGVTGYAITRNGSPLVRLAAVTAYQDTSVAPNTSYSYQVNAFDAAGNNSALSTAATVKTPSIPDTQAPSAPTGLSATAASSSQINLAWSASTDNVGVTGYDVYRGTTKVATVTTLSYGDTALAANTAYAYYVVARDAGGNSSAPSTTASATTKPPVAATILKGTIADSQTGSPLSGVRVVVVIGSNKLIYRTATDGTYSFNLSSGGRYSVTYSKKGYTAQSVSISLNNGDTVTQNVALVKR